MFQSLLHTGRLDWILSHYNDGAPLPGMFEQSGTT
jgi:hypothetical protein